MHVSSPLFTTSKVAADVGSLTPASPPFRMTSEALRIVAALSRRTVPLKPKPGLNGPGVTTPLKPEPGLNSGASSSLHACEQSPLYDIKASRRRRVPHAGFAAVQDDIRGVENRCGAFPRNCPTQAKTGLEWATARTPLMRWVRLHETFVIESAQYEWK